MASHQTVAFLSLWALRPICLPLLWAFRPTALLWALGVPPNRWPSRSGPAAQPRVRSFRRNGADRETWPFLFLALGHSFLALGVPPNRSPFRSGRSAQPISFSLWACGPTACATFYRGGDFVFVSFTPQTTLRPCTLSVIRSGTPHAPYLAAEPHSRFCALPDDHGHAAGRVRAGAGIGPVWQAAASRKHLGPCGRRRCAGSIHPSAASPPSRHMHHARRLRLSACLLPHGRHLPVPKPVPILA